MYCPKCGWNNYDNAAFCQRCGTPLHSNGVPTPPQNGYDQQGGYGPQGQQPGSQGMPQNGWHSDIFMPPPLQQPKKKNKGLLVGLIVGGAVIIIAVIVALVLLLGGGSKDSQYEKQISLGDKYFEQLNYAEAILAYEKAIDIDPKRAEGYEKLSNTYIAVGDLKNAREVVLEGIEKAEDTRALWAQLDRIDEQIEAQTSKEDNPEKLPEDENSQIAAETGKENSGESAAEGNENTEETQDPSHIGNTTKEIDKNQLLNSGKTWVSLMDHSAERIGDYIYVLNRYSIEIYDLSLDLIHVSGFTDLEYISGAFTDGSDIYYSILWIDGSSSIERMNLQDFGSETIFSSEKSVTLGGVSGEYLYYAACEEETWYAPELYRVSISGGQPMYLGYSGCNMDYVGSDFIISTGFRSDVSPTFIDIISPDGSRSVRVTEKAQMFLVSGRTIYYNEMVAEDYNWYPWVIKSYNIDTGEYRTLSDVVYLAGFQLLPDRRGVIGIEMEEGENFNGKIVKLDFASGQVTEIGRYEKCYGSFQVVGNHLYMMNANVVYRFTEDGSFEPCGMAAENEYVYGVIELPDGSICMVANDSDNQKVLRMG